MNIICADSRSFKTEIKKQIFQLKPIRKDGLIIQIHHTIPQKGCTKTKRIRFVCTTFNNTGTIVANADIDGNIFLTDFNHLKYWCLPNYKSCTALIFSNLNQDQLIIGIINGDLLIIDIHTGVVCAVLNGHKYPVKYISFAQHLCLTASLYEAFIFDLCTGEKVHELTLESQVTLKQVLFMPVAFHIVACFSDDHIHVWNHENFETVTQILPTDWKKFSLKSIAFTRNGSSMILSGYSSTLVEFSLDTWSLTKIINLPKGINSVRQIDFLSQQHDGGANRFLIILSNDGILYFLDMNKCFVTGRIQKECEIISFVCSANGVNLSLILHSGEVNVYKIANYIEVLESDENCFVDEIEMKRKLKLFLPKQVLPKQNLDIKILRSILKEFNEYPKAYRSLIWSNILQLPNNFDCFKAIANKSKMDRFKNIDNKYPLMNKMSLRSLKKLLSNLSSWCPLLTQVDFLPLFVFPFMKIFENDPATCFEAIITVIINWCQHWFEYLPSPPMNILSIIENLMIEHDNQLATHLSSNGVTSQLYAWNLLEVAFSEVLTINEWCILWDHIFSNEPSFLLMTVLAYNILNRATLMTLTRLDDYEFFYHNQNPIDIKKLVSKSYYFLNNTNQLYHPRQYLHHFTELPKGSYPMLQFNSKFLIGKDEDEHLTEMQEAEERLIKLEEELGKYDKSEKEREEEFQMKEEEMKRLAQMEQIHKKKILQERERIDKQRLIVSKLRTRLYEKQTQSLEESRRKIEQMNLDERKRELNQLLLNVEQSSEQKDLEVQRTEEELSKHYMELMKQKVELEELLLRDKKSKMSDINKEQEKVNKEFEIREHKNSVRFQNKFKIPMSISIADNAVQEVDMKIAEQNAQKQETLIQNQSSEKIKQLENDTKSLELEVQKLLGKYTKTKMQQVKKKLNEL